MAMNFDSNPNFYSFASAGEIISDFEALLKTYGIKIRHSSQLEAYCLNVIDLIDKQEKPHLANNSLDIRSYFREIMGLRDLMVKIIRVKNHPNFNSLLPHLKLLNDCSAPQNIKSLPTDQDSNKIFELFMSTIAMCCGTDVVIDNPQKSKGDNPDILITIHGERWGIACKVMHTDNARTWKDRIEEGCKQMENSEAEIGVVTINLKNIIDHNKFWPLLNEEKFRNGAEPSYKVFPDEFHCIRILNDIGNHFYNRVNELLLQEKGTFDNFKKTLGVVLFLPASTNVIRNYKPMPTDLKKFHYIPLADQTPKKYLDIIAGCFNNALHNRD